MKKLENLKNKITLQTNWKDADPDITELYNFSSYETYINADKGNRKEIRILCDGRFYYFNGEITEVKSIEVY